MEDIRRMEDETQKELEEVVNPVGGVALIFFSPSPRMPEGLAVSEA